MHTFLTSAVMRVSGEPHLLRTDTQHHLDMGLGVPQERVQTWWRADKSHPTGKKALDTQLTPTETWRMVQATRKDTFAEKYDVK
jgi:hypothetical protein